MSKGLTLGSDNSEVRKEIVWSVEQLYTIYLCSPWIIQPITCNKLLVNAILEAKVNGKLYDTVDLPMEDWRIMSVAFWNIEVPH